MIRATVFAFFAVTFTGLTLHADIFIDTGASAQNFVLTGQGPTGAGNGTYTIQQGSCTASAGTTTCTLSGSLGPGGSPGFTSGTYAFITTFATSDVDPIQGESEGVYPAANSNDFFYTFLAPDVSVVLDLAAPGGTFDVPLVTNGSFDAGTGFGFAYTGTENCTGVATCSQGLVGITAGATISGPVDISASFANPVPEPSPVILLLTVGLFVITFTARNLKRPAPLSLAAPIGLRSARQLSCEERPLIDCTEAR
jgi:hypothetical protein